MSKENVFSAKSNRYCLFSRWYQVLAIFPKYPQGSFVPAFLRFISPLWSEAPLSAGSQRTGLGPPSADMDTGMHVYQQVNISLLWSSDFTSDRGDNAEEWQLPNTQGMDFSGDSWWRLCVPRRRHGFGPWAGKIPWRRKWQPTPVFLPGKFYKQRSLVGSRPQDCKGSDTT